MLGPPLDEPPQVGFGPTEFVEQFLVYTLFVELIGEPVEDQIGLFACVVEVGLVGSEIVGGVGWPGAVGISTELPAGRRVGSGPGPAPAGFRWFLRVARFPLPIGSALAGSVFRFSVFVFPIPCFLPLVRSPVLAWIGSSIGIVAVLSGLCLNALLEMTGWSIVPRVGSSLTEGLGAIDVLSALVLAVLLVRGYRLTGLRKPLGELRDSSVALAVLLWRMRRIERPGRKVNFPLSPKGNLISANACCRASSSTSRVLRPPGRLRSVTNALLISAKNLKYFPV